MMMPSCAPRPVPTISAVGVARPSAHGQAMMSTATAAVNAVAALAPTASQPAVCRDGRLRMSPTVSPNRSRQTFGDRPLTVVRVRNDSDGRTVAAPTVESEGGFNSLALLSGAETCELVLALDAIGQTARAREQFAAMHHLREEDGSYWTGLVFADGKREIRLYRL